MDLRVGSIGVVESEAKVLLNSTWLALELLHELRVLELGGKLGHAVLVLEHVALGARVGLLAREVPPLELVEVNDTIAVQIKVLESQLKLLVVERISEIGRHFSQFGLVNGTTSVLVILVEGGHNFFACFRIVGIFKGIGKFLEPIDDLIGFRNFPLQLMHRQLLCRIGNGLLADGTKDASDGSAHVVFEELLLHFEFLLFNSVEHGLVRRTKSKVATVLPSRNYSLSVIFRLISALVHMCFRMAIFSTLASLGQRIRHLYCLLADID